jgi:3-oxoacyl-[acyl-carrier protein] reductase
MDLGIKNRVALIMASSSGLGKSIVRRFLMEGATVMMASRNEEMLNRAVQELTDDTSVTPYYTVCDITKGEQIKNLIRSTTEKLGPISILVNNAGGASCRNL